MENLKNLSNALKQKKPGVIKMTVGLDGFVDEIIHVVDRRIDFNNFTRISTIADFGSRISKAAGLSTNIEFVPVQAKLGGNGPIFANALLEYGVKLSYMGAIGRPDIHPVFKKMAERCEEVYPLSDPGHTDALEFNDGKLLLGKIEVLNGITWASFKDMMGGAEKIAGLINGCDLFGMENWTMTPHMSEIWEGLIKEVFPLINDKDIKPFAFFDLADPEKRNEADILHAMDLIKAFGCKFRCILGLNLKEAHEIAVLYKIPTDGASLESIVTGIYEKLGIYCLVVHPTKEACACVNGEYFHAAGPYCKKPVLTTGAGDNFNAGFCLGQCLGFDISDSLLLGVATSGFYVRNAKSPTLEDIIGFFDDWEMSRLD